MRLQNEKPDWSRHTPWWGVDSKKADGRIRLVPELTPNLGDERGQAAAG
jgi:hypothetical protein